MIEALANSEAMKAKRERQVSVKVLIQPANKIFTKDEVAKHDNINDCWIILADNVYDVTKYVKEHPGGSRPLQNFSGTGKDHIAEFEQGYSKAALNKLR